MHQKRSVYYMLALAGTISAISCGSMKHGGKSKDLMPGTWQAQPIVVDGDSKDWPSPYPNYDAKAMVAYATSNDRNYLYVTMETGDEMTQIKILKQGMTVSIDTSGRKEQTTNISFPLPNDEDLADMLPAREGHHKDPGTLQLGRQLQQKLRKSAEAANQYSLEGFNGCTGGYMVNQTTACGIKVRLKIDEFKQLVWEAAIPFKAIYNKETISAADAGKPISVCFAVKAFKNPAAKANANASNASAADPSSGGGGMGAGGRSNSRPIGGGKGSNMADPMAHLYESSKTWKHFSIVYQN